MGAPIRQEITKTLTSLMSHTEDNIRTATAAALGALVSSLSADEKTDVILTHLLGESKSEPCNIKLNLMPLAVIFKKKTVGRKQNLDVLLLSIM